MRSMALDPGGTSGHILFAAGRSGKSALGRLVADNMGVPYSSMDMPVKWKSLQRCHGLSALGHHVGRVASFT